MGKPRMIILIRHAQSEGNKNRDIHQMIPDHRVQLTDEGKRQAEEAGHRLRGMLKPDDNIQFFTSPYRRARETTEGILSTLTASDPEYGPSPFPRHTIKVFEEPRLREQDFGNFQPCSAEMERMWQERADYGHFFYRIPNGESAADAYDRVSGFNESLWRSFSDPDFPSVCVLVTHGLMTRVFLMKWYHWSVEYFEDLRNVNHCEFVIMRQRENGGKYLLENKLRTWSELKRRAAASTTAGPASTHPSSSNLSSKPLVASPGIPPIRKWGGCQGGCDHKHADFPRRRQNTHMQDIALPLADVIPPPTADKANHPIVPEDLDVAENSDKRPMSTPRSTAPRLPPPHATRKASITSTASTTSPVLGATPSNTTNINKLHLPIHSRIISPYGRDAGGSLSGAATPADGLSDLDSDGGGGGSSSVNGNRSASRTSYFERHSVNPSGFDGTKNAPTASGRGSEAGSERSVRKVLRKKHTEDELEAWVRQSGMGAGTRADALGDRENERDCENEGDEASLAVHIDIDKEMEEDRSIGGSVY